MLFGDVYLCGGQSNMEYGMPAVTNMTIEKQDVTPYDMSKQCAWASINVQGVGWVNASVEVHPNEPPFTEMDLVASGVSGTVLSTSYGWGPIPMLSAYDEESNLPVLPWNETIN